MKKKMNKKGFTLVEIIVVLVIIAIMAAFAIPAYNGFIDRARQSEILGEARVFLLAAQTAGQEKYTLKGSNLVASVSTTVPSEAASLLTSVDALADLKATTFFSVTFSTSGVVTSATIYNGTYYATYASGSWTTSNTGTPLTSNLVTIA